MQNYYQRPAFRQPYQNRENSREATREINRQKPCDVKDKLRKEFPVAMAYVLGSATWNLIRSAKVLSEEPFLKNLTNHFLAKGDAAYEKLPFQKRAFKSY